MCLTLRAVPALSVLVLSLFSSSAAASDAYKDEDDTPRRPGAEVEQDEQQADDERLSAGGLSAPEPLGEQGDRRSEIEKDLQQADERDAGRGLEFAWLAVDVGYQFASLEALGEKNFLPTEAKTSTGGVAWGAAGGVRLLYFTLGARFRLAAMNRFSLLSLLGEAGLRVPLGHWEPYAQLGVGFAAMTRHDFSFQGMKKPRGVDVRAAAGLDYYFSDSFSAGAQLASEVVLLRRRASAASADCTAQQDCGYLEVGSAAGLGVSSSVVLGLHF